MSSAGSSSDEKKQRLVTDSPEELSEAGDDSPGPNGDLHSPEASANGLEDDNETEGESSASRAIYDLDRHDKPEEYDEEDEEEEDLEEEEEEEQEEEEDEEDEEPALKYERLGGPVHDLLQKDSASVLVHSNKRLVCHVSALRVNTQLPQDPRNTRWYCPRIRYARRKNQICEASLRQHS